MKASVLAAVLGGASSALASIKGFNYASQGQAQDGFASQFKTAQGLEGTTGFNSARLYTMIQDGTKDTPISAIQAAIDTNTTLLLGLWTSVPQDAFNNELAALKSAIDQYGPQFADLVVGISVGSEDLYRISPMGIAAESGIGQSPDTLVTYIGQVRDTIKGTSLSSKPVGHVDTWNVYVNDTNSKVIAACDWLGLDEYPYYQTTDVNTIDNASYIFFESYNRVVAVAGGKPIWVTESGWPTVGTKKWGLAVASVDNAAKYWQDVACELECKNVPYWWYILADDGADPAFGVSKGGKPVYDLSCSKHQCGSTSSGSSGNGTSTGGNGSATATGSGSGSSATATGSAGGSGGYGGSGGSPTSGGSGGSSTSASGTTSPTPFTGAALKVEASIISIVATAAFAAFFL